MNFLDAHKIVHDYMDMVAIKQKSGEIGKRASLLKNTKDEIIDAFKLFYAHMFLFNTRTNDEFENYEVCRWGLSLFIDDTLMDECLECYRILDDKSIIGRFKNKSAIPSAKAKQTDLVMQIGSLVTLRYRSEEMDAFIEKILPLSKEAKKRQVAILSDKPKSESWERNFMHEIVDYCCKVYEIADISMDSTDAEYFYSFDILKNLAIRPHLADLFDRYKDYILSHQ